MGNLEFKAALDGYLNSCKVIQKFSTKTDKGYEKKKQQQEQQNKAKIKKNCDAALIRKRKKD